MKSEIEKLKEKVKELERRVRDLETKLYDQLDKLKKEGKTNDYIEITAEDGTITKIYAYIN